MNTPDVPIALYLVCILIPLALLALVVLMIAASRIDNNKQ
jgi:hypothetical protein